MNMQVPVPLWEQLARQWARLGPPLRPSADDLRTVQTAVDECAQRLGPSRRATALILGVTPELRQLRWQAGTRVLASDLSLAMIRGVGGLATVSGSDVCHGIVQANWCRLPLADGSCDLVLGDACLAQLKACGAAEVMREAARVLGPAGVLVTRVFVRPDNDEAPDTVWDQLLAGQIGSFHAFKLRLLAALHRAEGQVRVVDAWQFFSDRCPCPRSLAERLGWPEAQVRTIEAYRGQSTVYWLPTLAEFSAMARPGFEELSCRWPTYELGERCPTFIFRAREVAATTCTQARVAERARAGEVTTWRTCST